MGELLEFVQVHSRRAPKPPILRAQFRNPGNVQAITLAGSELVLEQECNHVNKVPLIYLDNLQLGEEQLCQRKSRCVQLKPVLQRDGVTKIQPFVEDVDMDAVGGTPKYCTSPFGNDEYLAVFRIAETS